MRHADRFASKHVYCNSQKFLKFSLTRSKNITIIKMMFSDIHVLSFKEENTTQRCRDVISYYEEEFLFLIRMISK